MCCDVVFQVVLSWTTADSRAAKLVEQTCWWLWRSLSEEGLYVYVYINTFTELVCP
jgi:hypothetical protein